jgi:hypothetical protein
MWLAIICTTSAKVYGAMSQKTVIFTFASMTTCSVTYCALHRRFTLHILTVSVQCVCISCSALPRLQIILF